MTKILKPFVIKMLVLRPILYIIKESTSSYLWTYSLIWINTTKGSNVTFLVHMHFVIINGIFTTMYICIQQRIKFKLANIQTYFESYLLGWFKKNNSIKIIVCWLFRDMNVILLRLVRFNINTAMTSTW